eukprot:6544195-Pyramimonas_sp.AAC.1
MRGPRASRPGPIKDNLNKKRNQFNVDLMDLSRTSDEVAKQGADLVRQLAAAVGDSDGLDVQAGVAEGERAF